MNSKYFTCYGFDCYILGPLDGSYMYSIRANNEHYVHGFIDTNDENEPIRFVKDLCRDVFLMGGGDNYGGEDY